MFLNFNYTLHIIGIYLLKKSLIELFRNTLGIFDCNYLNNLIV